MKELQTPSKFALIDRLVHFCDYSIRYRLPQMLVSNLVNQRPHTHLFQFTLVNEKTLISDVATKFVREKCFQMGNVNF